jgi:hypothetical protein
VVSTTDGMIHSGTNTPSSEVFIPPVVNTSDGGVLVPECIFPSVVDTSDGAVLVPEWYRLLIG